jgi:hypothetical protein
MSDRPDVSVRMNTLARFASEAGCDPVLAARWTRRLAAWERVGVLV